MQLSQKKMIESLRVLYTVFLFIDFNKSKDFDLGKFILFLKKKIY